MPLTRSPASVVWHRPRFAVRPERRGVALVLAFAVLVALFLLALPFVRSMHAKREVVQSHSHFLEARRDAESARALAIARLRQTHTAVQQRQAQDPDVDAISRWILRGVDPPITPEVDTVYQFDVEPLLNDLLVHRTYMSRQELLDVQSATGRLWSVRVEDEQGKVDANTASPVLMGNLMGGTVLAEEITPQQQRIPIEFGGLLPPEGGFVVIGNELIQYEACVPGGAPGAPWELVGCLRGRQDLSQRLIEWHDVSRLSERRPSYGEEFSGARRHNPGTAVIPGIAYKLHRFKVEPVVEQHPARFRDVPGMRVVENYPLFGGGASERLTDEQYEAARPFLTTVSQPAPLGYPSWFLPHVYKRSREHPTAVWIELDDNRGIQPGSVLRFTTRASSDSLPAAAPENPREALYEYPPTRRGSAAPMPRDPSGSYRVQDEESDRVRAQTLATVVDVHPSNPRRVRLDRRVDGYAFRNQTIVEVLRRAPININTAPIEVLIATFHGVSMRGSEGIAYQQAAQLARRAYERIHDAYQPDPFVDYADFRHFVTDAGQEVGLEPRQIQALLLNARINHHPRLRAPTAPFVYRSYDTFSITSSATRTAEPLDGSPGIPRAHHGIRDIMTIGSSGVEGEVDHSPMARLLELRRQGFGGEAHLKATGQERGLISLPPKPSRRSFNRETESLRSFSGSGRLFEEVEEFSHRPIVDDEEGTMRPFLTSGRLSFWIRPERLRENEETVLFDIGEEQYANRLSLVMDNQRDALVLRMADASLTTGFQEVVYPIGELDAQLPWERGNREDAFRSPVAAMRDEVWYHVEAFWQGTEFRDAARNDRVVPVRLSLLIDGLPVTPIQREPSYKSFTREDGRGSRSEMRGRLTAPLPTPRDGGRIEDPQAEDAWWRVTLDDASGYPSEGVVYINGEAIAYSRIEGNSLTGELVEVENADYYLIQGFQRGARRTAARSHTEGTFVAPFGYSARLRFDPRFEYLPPAAGRTVSPTGEQTIGVIANPVTTPEYIDSPTFGPESGLPATLQDSLGLYVEDFPPSGYMLVHGYAVADYEEVGEDQYRAVLHGADDPDDDHPNGYPGRVCYEIIYYDGVEPGEDGLVMRNIVRNALPVENIPDDAYQDQGVFHFINGAQVDIISWEVSPAQDYLSSGGFVQLKQSGEVLRYTHVEGSYLVFNHASASSRARDNAWRAQLNTRRTTKEAPLDQKVLPVFRVRGRENSYRPVGRGDHVTLVHGQNQRRVDEHYDEPGRPLRVHWTRALAAREQYVTLDGFVEEAYIPGNHPERPAPGTRLLKWPSGELPAVAASAVSIGGRSPRWAQGSEGAVGRFELDELHVERHRRYEEGAQDLERLASLTPLREFDRPANWSRFEERIEQEYQEDYEPLRNFYTRLWVSFDPREHGFDPEAGVIQMKDELIAYQGIEEANIAEPNGGPENTLYYFDGLVRGYLYTPIRSHTAHTEIINFYPMRVVRGFGYQNGLSDLQEGSEALGFNVAGDTDELEREGYLLGGYRPHQWEVIGYQPYPGQRNRLLTSHYRPGRVDLGRGRFGTPIADMRRLPNPPVLLALPYRYQDPFAAPRHQRCTDYGFRDLLTFNAPDQMLAGGAATAAGGRWQSFTWGMALYEPLGEGRGASAPPDRPHLVDEHMGRYAEARLLLKPSTIEHWESERITAITFPSHPTVNRQTYDLAQARDPESGRELPWAEFSSEGFFSIARNRLNYADGMEWRVAITFRPHAFHADAWKWTPRVLGPRLSYTSTDVLHDSRTTSR